MAKRKADFTADFWGMARSFLHSYMAKVRRASPKTVEAYRESLECYLSFLEVEKEVGRAEVDFERFERASVKEWVAWMQDAKGYSPKTVALRLTGVRSFLRWCADEDVCLASLYSGVRTITPPKAPKRPVEYLGDGELAAVLAAYGGATGKSRRNRMLLVLLYETAARVSEFANVTVGDVRLANPARVVLTGKGDKTRVVPLGNACVRHLGVYLEEFHPGAPDPGDPLFYSMRAGRKAALSTDSVSRILKAAGAIARGKLPSVPERLHCHLVRRTRAMALYRAGVPLPIIMQLLGHESMSTTSSFYAFATEEMLAKAMESAAPAPVSEETGWLTEERKRVLYSLK